MMKEEQMNGMGEGFRQPVNGSYAAPADDSWKQMFSAQPNSVTYTVPRYMGKTDTEANKRMSENFSFFGPATAMYAIFYAICMYRNDAGIAFFAFITATAVFFYETMRRLEMEVKKGSGFYLAGMLLLAVSTFCTDDMRIIVMNKTGIFLLMISLLLRQFYNTAEWGPGKYLESILATIFGSLEELKQPFRDGKASMKNGTKEKKMLAWNALLGVLVAIPFLVAVILLLSSADIFFEQLTKSLFDNMNVSESSGILWRTLAVFFGSYALLVCLCRHMIREEVTDKRTGEPVTAITATSLLTFVYIIFSGIQIFGLFLGKLQLPEEYTYAEYAKEGFFQLLAVGVLNLVIVLVCLKYVRESRGLKAVLTIMSLCTYIMIASSAMRLIMYVQAYNLTFSRVLGLWTLLLLAVLFAGVMMQIFKKDFPLFRYSMAAATILYLGLSFAHPDYIIASVNVQQERIDNYYLSRLSADAAPVLVPYIRQEPDFGDRYLNSIAQWKDMIDPRTFNVSRYRAVNLLP